MSFLQTKEVTEKLPKSIDIRSYSRPPAIVYIIEEIENSISHWILDGVFFESYCRWGGAHTLIIPTINGQIQEIYKLWIKLFDPDFVYSYTDLSEDTITELNSLTMPIAMIRHKERDNPDRWRDYIPDWGHILNPIRAVSTISAPDTNPSWHTNKLKQNVFLTQRYEHDLYRFFPDNFGVAHDRHTTTYGREGVFETLSYCAPDTPENHYVGNIRCHDDTEILSKLAIGELKHFYKLSSIHSDGIGHPHDHHWQNSFHLYLGDSIKDRVNMWNSRNLSRNSMNYSFSSLRIPKDQCKNTDFIEKIGDFLNKNNFAGQSNSPANVTVYSSSLTKVECESFASILRNKTWNSVYLSQDLASIAIPSKASISRQLGKRGTRNPAFKVQESSHSHISPKPAHIQYLPTAVTDFSSGQWIVEFDIERHISDCRISNVFNDWKLPRRSVITHAFTKNLSRVTNHNCLALLTLAEFNPTYTSNIGTKDNVLLRFPTDEIVFRYLLLEHHQMQINHDIREFLTQDLGYAAIKVSDKGQLHRGVIALFDNQIHAAAILTNSYWRKLIRESLASNDDLIRELKLLAKESSNNEIMEIAENILSSNIKESRAYTLDSLKSRIDSLSSNQLKQIKESFKFVNDKEVRKYLKLNLTDTIEYFVHIGVIQQVADWGCEYCGNKNQRSLDTLGIRNLCDVCEHEYFTPIDLEWKYQISPFVVSTLAQYNGLTVLWGIATLIDRTLSRQATYIPEVDLYRTHNDPKTKKEIDFVALIEGSFAIGEVKMSATSFFRDESEVSKYLDIVSRIEPDFAYLIFEQYSNAEDTTGSVKQSVYQLFNELSEKMPYPTSLKMLIAEDDPEFKTVPHELGPYSHRTRKLLYK